MWKKASDFGLGYVHMKNRYVTSLYEIYRSNTTCILDYNLLQLTGRLRMLDLKVTVNMSNFDQAGLLSKVKMTPSLMRRSCIRGRLIPCYPTLCSIIYIYNCSFTTLEVYF